MHRFTSRFQLLIAVAAVTAACAACKTKQSTDPAHKGEPVADAPTNEPTAPEEPVATEEPQAPAPEASLEERQAAASATNAFTFDLYRKLDKSGNSTLSPFSVATALALVHLGARGDTAKALGKALHVPSSGDYHASLGALLGTSRGGGKADAFGENVPAQELNVANSLWLQRGFAAEAAYLEGAKSAFRAKVAELDTEKPEKAAAAINDWTSDATNGRIKDLVNASIINELTRMIIVNAVYFKGRWREPFREENTADRPFFPEKGAERKVPTMAMTHFYRYARVDGTQVVSIPYWSTPETEMSMLVLLPEKRQGLPELEKKLTPEMVEEWVGKLNHKMVELYLPKFEAEGSFELKPVLTDLGLGGLFGDRADLSGISKQQLFLAAVIHRTWIKVDEKGTEAAAATAIPVAGAGIPEEKPVFRADHPFLYLIRDGKTGAILFIGRVASP